MSCWHVFSVKKDLHSSNWPKQPTCVLNTQCGQSNHEASTRNSLHSSSCKQPGLSTQHIDFNSRLSGSSSLSQTSLLSSFTVKHWTCQCLFQLFAKGGPNEIVWIIGGGGQVCIRVQSMWQSRGVRGHAACYLRLYEGGGGKINMSCALSFQPAVSLFSKSEHAHILIS